MTDAGTVLVSGATGHVGGEVVRALAAAGAPVRALVRTPPREGLPAEVEQVEGDLDHPDSLAPALDGVAAVFLLPGFSDMSQVAERIAAAGVRRVVLLSGSSAGDGDPTNAVSEYMRDSEAAVRGSGVAWTILRPSGFMSNTLRWLPQLRAGDTIVEPFAGVPIAVIDPYDIAAVAALALVDGGHEGRVYRLTGPEPLLPADRARILGEVLGRPLRLVPQPDDEARTAMLAAMPAKYVDAFFRFYVDGTLDESVVLPTVAEVCGRPPRTFAEWARTHADEFGQT
jgi:uncharacterized protein YbjT (DUF2867 family)